MKVYFNLNPGGFSNCYIVANEVSQEAVIIDPGKVTEKLISQIEDMNLKLSAVLITHNHGSHVDGLRTLRKIYNPRIYAGDWEVSKNETSLLSGDGTLKVGKMNVRFMSVPGHSSDSIVYIIENLIFTGDVISAGEIGATTSTYSEYILKTNIEEKIFSQTDTMLVMPGHGPPTSLGALKSFMELGI